MGTFCSCPAAGFAHLGAEEQGTSQPQLPVLLASETTNAESPIMTQVEVRPSIFSCPLIQEKNRRMK
jgi:hypothetical protein